MPTIHKEILIQASPDAVWDAARDVGALHTRLVPGFVTHTEMLPDADPPARMVTFASGMTVKEVIVDCDDLQRRLVWTIESPNVRHHNGVLQVFPAEAGWCRVVWIADVLPKAIAEVFSPSMAAGLEAMKRQFEAAG
jgi:hypothetical protein